MTLPDIPVKVTLRVVKKFSGAVVTKKAFYGDVIAMLKDLGFLVDDPGYIETKRLLKKMVRYYDDTFDEEVVLGVLGREMTSAIKTADARFTIVRIDFSDNKAARRIAYLVGRPLNTEPL